MYRVLFLCFCFLMVAVLTAHHALAQNLVPNGSFEEYDECPDWPGHFHTHLHHWESWRGSPDFFHSCDTTTNVSSIHSNVMGYQLPRTGNGYGGILGLISGGQRELMGIELVSPLEIGQQYYLEFYWNRAFGGWGHNLCDCAMSHLGALFTTNSFNSSDDPAPITNFAHVYDSSLLTDSANWQKISGWVMADSAYTHLSIGNFFDLDSCEIAYFNGSPNEIQLNTYYFIEDICVSINPENCDASLRTNIHESDILKLYPNPAIKDLWIDVNSAILACKVYDTAGKLMIETFTSNKLEIGQLPSGLYIIHVETITGTYQGKIVKTP